MDTGTARQLNGKIARPLAVALTPDRATLMFFYEVGQQHGTATYQQLLKAPVIPPSLAKLLATHHRLVGKGSGRLRKRKSRT